MPEYFILKKYENEPSLTERFSQYKVFDFQIRFGILSQNDKITISTTIVYVI